MQHHRATPSPMQQAGALFGLDARLAMTVFSILAIVAGYVMFNRINLARTAALYSEITALEHAMDGYQADMGTFYLFTLARDPSDDETASHERDLTALWNKDVIAPGFQPRYNGPYLHNTSLKHRQFGRYGVIYAQGDRKDVCTMSSDCYAWLTLSDVPAEVWKAINAMVDEGPGKDKEAENTAISSGRLQADGTTEKRILFYRMSKRPDGM